MNDIEQMNEERFKKETAYRINELESKSIIVFDRVKILEADINELNLQSKGHAIMLTEILKVVKLSDKL